MSEQLIKRLQRQRLKDGLVWYLSSFKELRYYVFTLTLCRIGHKPKVVLGYRPFSQTAIVHLSCTRCTKQLAVETLKIHPEADLTRRDSANR